MVMLLIKFIIKVTGVVLANASIDLAFHDKKKKNYYHKLVFLVLNFYRNINHTIKKIHTSICLKNVKRIIYPDSEEYLLAFFIGLLESVGRISVDLAKSSSKVRIRFVISLKNNMENLNMLTLFEKNICGHVSIQRKNKYVTWVCYKSEDLLKIFSIIEKYPLLTTRKQLQLDFALNCIRKPDIENFFKKRANKYSSQREICEKYYKSFEILEYFPAWLSGFIEGSGSFFLRKNKYRTKHTKCFSIGQNNDEYIIKAVKNFFNSNNKIQLKKINFKDDYQWKYNNWGGYYKIEMYGVVTLNIIYNHFLKNPLLGNKQISYEKWKKTE